VHTSAISNTMKELTHMSRSGKVKMVDVGMKPVVRREAVAVGKIYLQAKTLELIRKNDITKGNVLTTAQIAGIQAAKKTSELIPLCHGLSLSAIDIDFLLLKAKRSGGGGFKITARVQIAAQTGVEMEALCAVSVAALTIYDMCKGVDKKMRISDIKLLSKRKYEN